MFFTSKKMIAIMMVLLMIFTFAACSKTGGTEPQVETKLDKIKKSGKIVLGTAADYPPYEFHKEINGKDEVVGFDIEIAKAIAADLGVELEIVDMKFDGLLAALVADDIDFIIAGMVPKEERKKSVDFSIPYYQAEQRMLIRAEDSDKLKSEEDFKGLKMGAQKSTVQEDIAKEKFADNELISLSKITDLVLELKNKKIDGLVLVAPVAAAYAKQNQDLYMPDILLGKEDGVAVAVNKGNTVLLDEINKSLEKLMKEDAITKFIQEASDLADNN